MARAPIPKSKHELQCGRASAPVVEEAGGIVTDWQGKPLTLSSDGTIVACGDERVHAELLEILAG